MLAYVRASRAFGVTVAAALPDDRESIWVSTKPYVFCKRRLLLLGFLVLESVAVITFLALRPHIVSSVSMASYQHSGILIHQACLFERFWETVKAVFS